MKLRPRLAPLYVALTLAALSLFCAAPARAAGPGDAGDVCRSAFESNPEARRKGDASAAPIHMALFGDSIMWGQGLKERDKFWCRVKQWVELKTGRDVRVWPYAHAGAVIERPAPQPGKADEWHFDDGKTRLGGEVNVSFPTINEQVGRAVEQMKSGKAGINLVLVDGCINDVNFRTFLDVRNEPSDVVEMATKKCKEPMQRLLTRIMSEFPAAYVIVTGYFPVIYKGINENGKNVVKGTANNQLTRLAFEKLGGKCGEGDGGGCKGGEARDHLDLLSRAWYETSNQALAEAVRQINSAQPAAAEPRVHFAELHFPAEYAFSTKQSMLWNIRFGATGVGGVRKFVAVALDIFRAIDTNDDRWDERGDQCKQASRLFKERVKALGEGEQKKELKKLLKDFVFVCRRGSIGHPNRFGALLYAQAITARLQTILPQTGWIKEPAGADAGGAQPQR